MDKTCEMVMQYIEEAYKTFLDELINDDRHINRTQELHDKFNAVKNAVEASKFDALWYNTDTCRTFYEKGFKDGIIFHDELMSGSMTHEIAV